MSVPTTALPADLLPVAHLYGVVAKFYRGDPGSGSVTFKTDGAVIAGDPAILIYGYEQTVQINTSTGRFEVDWVPGDDPDGAPSTVTMTFDLDNNIVIPPLTITVPAPVPRYPQKVVNGTPQVDSNGNPIPDTTQQPTYAAINVFAQPTVPILDAEIDQATIVTTDTDLFLRTSLFATSGGVATLNGRGLVPVEQLINPATFVPGNALVFDPTVGGLTGVAVDPRWRGSVTSQPTDQGTQGDYFTNSALTDGGAIMWGCVRSGGPIVDGSPGEALWVPFGQGGSGGGGGVVAVQGTAPIQSSGGDQPAISILPATAVTAGSMSAAHFAKLNGVATNATAYDDERAQDAVARMLLAGNHAGVTFQYDDAGNAMSATVTAGSGAVSVVQGAGVVQVTGTTSNPVVSVQASSTSQDGTISAAQATKLSLIADQATRNQTDAYLLARGNHQGTQVASTISDLEATVRGYQTLIRTVTAGTTVQAADETVRVNSSAAVTVSLPANAVTAIPIGRLVVISQVGAGVVTIGGSGVTFNGNLKTAGQNTDISVLKVGTNEWDVRGGVA